jgi:glycosyltransferase involved in cell wall biosynthesis
MIRTITISFIIIAYNEKQTIGRCLDAILAQNNLENYEIIVVDDGSIDATANIVEEYARNNSKIILHRLIPNQGRGAARAAGVKRANGKYLAFVDADIILPTHWINTCLSYMNKYDAVGGIAVPDGDVNYIYTAFNLDPKIASQSTIVTGSNGLYKRSIFEGLNFDTNLRDGEDVAFNHQMVAGNFKVHCIDSLTVAHKETKTFFKSARWLYQSGLGATRQLKQFKKIRLPDLAYFGFMSLFIASIVVSVFFKEFFLLLIPFIYIFLVDIVYIQKKFNFEFCSSFRYVAGIVVYWFLLASYFAGRTVGWFATASEVQRKKKVMVCFDLEGKLGMPFEAEYDIEKTTYCILDILANYDVKAVFFVVGKLIEERPDLIKKIADQGHEIGIHGYAHEHLEKLNGAELSAFSDNLSRVENLLEKLIGKRPKGFRAPYLMDPVYYTSELYRILEEHGYKWVSNRKVLYPEEFFRPDHFYLPIMWQKNNLISAMLIILLNMRMILNESMERKKGISRIMANIKWLISGAGPFRRDNIIELPILTPLDCDLIGLPKPAENTPDYIIRYMINTLSGGIEKKGYFYSITFHDWIVGTANRTQLLEKILDNFSKMDNVVFISSAEI